MLCGVIYRHPSSGLEDFMNYLNTVIGKINRENKYCAIMGDSNIDLLKSESQTSTDDFLNNLVTSFFQPYILQQTRIINHSATLIDNIFF